LKLKANKDTGAFQSAAKKIGAEHKVDTLSVQELHTTIRGVSSELGDKVAELQRQDRLVRDLQIQQGLLVEKLVSGKIAKQPFIDQEGSITRKKQDALEKIMNIIKAF